MYSQENKGIAASKEESESLKLPEENCNRIENDAANPEASDGGDFCAEVNDPLYYDLADLTLVGRLYRFSAKETLKNMDT